MAKQYVNSESFRLALIDSNMKGELTPQCLGMLLKMVEHIQRSFKYMDQQDKEDVSSHAIEVLLKQWKKYDIERQNPFAYFTRVIYNGLYAGWNEINKKRTPFSISNIFTEST